MKIRLSRRRFLYATSSAIAGSALTSPAVAGAANLPAASATAETTAAAIATAAAISATIPVISELPNYSSLLENAICDFGAHIRTRQTSVAMAIRLINIFLDRIENGKISSDNLDELKKYVQIVEKETLETVNIINDSLSLYYAATDRDPRQESVNLATWMSDFLKSQAAIHATQRQEFEHSPDRSILHTQIADSLPTVLISENTLDALLRLLLNHFLILDPQQPVTLSAHLVQNQTSASQSELQPQSQPQLELSVSTSGVIAFEGFQRPFDPAWCQAPFSEYCSIRFPDLMAKVQLLAKNLQATAQLASSEDQTSITVTIPLQIVSV
ncbi:hypothetical protein OsccyDRAFT_4575 [Leptolyngbyaceae cyanobacterium JSC-12]|nr:hypothetical protein OsccyDRAFT_4575 [Leptolyngbyaceae cyanobacterium JSC-12]